MPAIACGHTTRKERCGSLSFSMTLFDSYKQNVSRPYIDYLRRLGMDFEVVRASGAVVEDQRGRKYIDCIGGYGNVNVGHNHPRVAEAMIHALESGQPFGWPFISDAHVHLTEKLAEVTPAGLECTLVVNTGSEATESALKLARLATGRSEIICCEGGWHGFTLGALSVSEPKMCKSFAPLLPGVRRVPFGDILAAAEAMSPQVAAMIVEPIQAENGGIAAPAGYLRQLADICTAAGVILIFDEIKTGMGKTGRLFACEFDQAEPDVLLLGKSLGGGVMPIGAMVAKRKWWSKFGLSFAMSSSSAAGNRLACAAGLAAIEVIQSENLCANAERQGVRLQEALTRLSSTHSEAVRAVTGRGLLLGLQVANPTLASEITMRCVNHGVLIMPAFLDRARLLIEPPLCISDAQVDEVIGALQKACDEVGLVKV
jgi:putrescine aminotransferase